MFVLAVIYHDCYLLLVEIKTESLAFGYRTRKEVSQVADWCPSDARCWMTAYDDEVKMNR